MKRIQKEDPILWDWAKLKKNTEAAPEECKQFIVLICKLFSKGPNYNIVLCYIPQKGRRNIRKNVVYYDKEKKYKGKNITKGKGER